MRTYAGEWGAVPAEWPAVCDEFAARAGFALMPHTILAGGAGSVAHGTHQALPGLDDTDIMAVVIPPREVALGTGHWESCQVQQGTVDLVVYSLRHYAKLLLKANPNVLGLLWVPPEHVLRVHPIGGMLRYERQRFLTRKLYPAFTGYAYDQLRRLKAFTVEDLDRYDVLLAILEAAGLEPQAVLQSSHGQRATWLAKDPYLPLEAFCQVHRRYFRGYMGVERKRRVREIGYDSKHAAHLIRLLRMGTEALVHQSLTVDRTPVDAEELRDIKRGQWSLAQVQAEAERWFAWAKDALEITALPEEPDVSTVNALVASWHLDFYLDEDAVAAEATPLSPENVCT